jgi:peptidoglycan hydrolase CwlO-like protein
MTSEFDLLSDKINQLVQLVQSLRQQNAALRQQIDALDANSAALAARMDEAHDRLAAVLEQLPAPEPEPAEPEQPHDEEIA